MADERKEDSDDSSGEQERRRKIRRDLRDAHEDMQENKRQMADLHSTKIDVVMDNLQAVSENASKTRELQLHASCLKDVTAALRAQATSLCDMSGRFNWQDLSDKAKHQFQNPPGLAGFNWEKFGCEARMMFNCASSFNTMAGPIFKEEKIRKISVRRQKEDNSGVENTTGQVIENHEEDGNDEATNARVANLLHYLESLKGAPFDLLRTLVDPSDPVQSVENFFDFSYLHKEKRVIHDVDEETSLLKAHLVDEELENRQKSQMVLSFSMREMQQMARVLHPTYYEDENGGTTSEPSSHSSSHGSSSSSSGGSKRVQNPLHREDELYEAKSAQEQVKILQERALKQAEAANHKKATSPGKKSAPSASQPAQGSRRSAPATASSSSARGRSQPQPSSSLSAAASSSRGAASSAPSRRTQSAAVSTSPSSRAAAKSSSRGRGKKQQRGDSSEGSENEEEDEEDEQEEESFRPAPSASRRSRGAATASAASSAPAAAAGSSSSVAARQTTAPAVAASSSRARTVSSPVAPAASAAPVSATQGEDAESPVHAQSSRNNRRSPSFSSTPAKPDHATSSTSFGAGSVKNELSGGAKRTRSEQPQVQQGKENNAYSPEQLPADVDLFPSTDSQGSGSSKSDATPIGRKSRRLV